MINYGAKLSEIEKDFLRANAKNHSLRKLAELIGKSHTLVYQYCRQHGIGIKSVKPTGRPRNTDRVPGQVKPVQRRVIAQKEEKVILVRPPAKYDNRSQQDVIDHYLKLEI